MYVDTKYNCNVVMEYNTYRHWEGQLVNILGGELAKHNYSYRERKKERKHVYLT